MDIAIYFILAGLLLITIFYASLLNYKVNELKSDRLEMEKSLSILTGAIDKTENGIHQLTISAVQGEHIISNQIKKAEILKIDLENFCEKANQVLTALDQRILIIKNETQDCTLEKNFDKKIVVAENKRPFKPVLNLSILR